MKRGWQSMKCCLMLLLAASLTLALGAGPSSQPLTAADSGPLLAAADGEAVALWSIATNFIQRVEGISADAWLCDRAVGHPALLFSIPFGHEQGLALLNLENYEMAYVPSEGRLERRAFFDPMGKFAACVETLGDRPLRQRLVVQDLASKQTVAKVEAEDGTRVELWGWSAAGKILYSTRLGTASYWLHLASRGKDGLMEEWQLNTGARGSLWAAFTQGGNRILAVYEDLPGPGSEGGWKYLALGIDGKEVGRGALTTEGFTVVAPLSPTPDGQGVLVLGSGIGEAEQPTGSLGLIEVPLDEASGSSRVVARGYSGAVYSPEGRLLAAAPQGQPDEVDILLRSTGQVKAWLQLKGPCRGFLWLRGDGPEQG